MGGTTPGGFARRDATISAQRATRSAGDAATLLDEVRAGDRNAAAITMRRRTKRFAADAGTSDPPTNLGAA